MKYFTLIPLVLTLGTTTTARDLSAPHPDAANGIEGSEIYFSRSTSPVDDNAGPLVRRECQARGSYGCSKGGYCWKECGSGNWCWTAENGGKGDWITCGNLKEPIPIGGPVRCDAGACSIGKCEDCGCSGCT